MKNQNKMKNQMKSYVTYFVMMFALLLTTAPAAQAANFTVNMDSDLKDLVPGDGICHAAYRTCTLRAAIEEANALPGKDNIGFSKSFSEPNALKTIVLTLGQLEIKSEMSIYGTSARKLMIDGNNASRVFNVTAPQSHIYISGLTIQNGFTYTPEFVSCAAGLCLVNGKVFLDRVTVRNNVSTGVNPQLREYGGGLANYDLMQLHNCTVSGNKGGVGGGIYNKGQMYMDNTTVSDNAAGWGGGIYIAGASSPYNPTAFLITFNITVSDNQAQTEGGGVWSNNAFSFTPVNTIVAGNVAPSNNDVHGFVNSQGNNLIENRGSSSGYVASDLPNGTNPLLGALQNNGGPTDTHVLMAGSPAIDAGNDCKVYASINCAPYGDDQRYIGFQRKVGSSVDIGAIEIQTQSAAVVQIGGKILKPYGRGLNNAIVTLTDEQGISRSAETDSNGRYSFDEVVTGKAYIVEVESRQYEYDSQELVFAGPRDDVDFVPVQR
jgi:hypothetical protein